MILFFGNFSGGHPGVPILLLVITLLSSGIITTPLLWLIMAGLLGLGAWQVITDAALLRVCSAPTSCHQVSSLLWGSLARCSSTACGPRSSS